MKIYRALKQMRKFSEYSRREGNIAFIRFRAYTLIILFIGSSVLLSLGQVSTQESRKLPSRMQEIVATLQPIDRLPESMRLHLAIGLPLRNQDGLSNLLRQIYDPASPKYHHYLTVEQFTERFGPAASDYQLLIGFAESSRLNLHETYRNRMLLRVYGSAA